MAIPVACVITWGVAAIGAVVAYVTMFGIAECVSARCPGHLASFVNLCTFASTLIAVAWGWFLLPFGEVRFVPRHHLSWMAVSWCSSVVAGAQLLWLFR